MTVSVKEENWVGTKEAAEFLGVKPATIRDWIRKGKRYSKNEDRQGVEI